MSTHPMNTSRTGYRPAYLTALAEAKAATTVPSSDDLRELSDGLWAAQNLARSTARIMPAGDARSAWFARADALLTQALDLDDLIR